jgi:hypothetical protein
MLTSIIAKLPMRNKSLTKEYYTKLGFEDISASDYPHYLLLQQDGLELHFFLHDTLNVLENDGQVYIRTKNIEVYYQMAISHDLRFSDGGKLVAKPWGQMEFSLLDPDHNLLTFGQAS